MLLIRATDILEYPHKDCGSCTVAPALKALSDSEIFSAIDGMLSTDIPDVEEMLKLLVTTAKVTNLPTTTETTFLVCKGKGSSR